MAEKKITKKECLEITMTYLNEQLSDLENIITQLKEKPEELPLYYDGINKIADSMYNNSTFYSAVKISKNKAFYKSKTGTPSMLSKKINKKEDLNGNKSYS